MLRRRRRGGRARGVGWAHFFDGSGKSSEVFLFLACIVVVLQCRCGGASGCVASRCPTCLELSALVSSPPSRLFGASCCCLELHASLVLNSRDFGFM